MKRLISCFVIMLTACAAVAQKRFEKTMDLYGVNVVEIDGSAIFKIDIETNKGKTLKIISKIDGEYHRELNITSKFVDNTIKIGAEFMPVFNVPNDKLSAHKVISIQLIISMPENMTVKILGNETVLNISGNYKKLVTRTESGSNHFQDITGEVDASSHKGSIFFKLESGNIIATSEYGKVVLPSIPGSEQVIRLKSVTGDIYVTKNE